MEIHHIVSIIYSKIANSSFVLVFAILTFTACGCTKTDLACIDETKISDGMCTMQYDPVCGCDGKTYSNACVAGRAGVTSWVQGECPENKG